MLVMVMTFDLMACQGAATLVPSGLCLHWASSSDSGVIKIHLIDKLQWWKVEWAVGYAV